MVSAASTPATPRAFCSTRPRGLLLGCDLSIWSASPRRTSVTAKPSTPSSGSLSLTRVPWGDSSCLKTQRAFPILSCSACHSRLPAFCWPSWRSDTRRSTVTSAPRAHATFPVMASHSSPQDAMTSFQPQSRQSTTTSSPMSCPCITTWRSGPPPRKECPSEAPYVPQSPSLRLPPTWLTRYHCESLSTSRPNGGPSMVSPRTSAGLAVARMLSSTS
mmetsp:Transcript_1084/g.2903  ORF Transcript_1084/g.2903 Transcript_1084/m.2903 type:complete len:217 (+) Transcript_1084:388-1038(+)